MQNNSVATCSNHQPGTCLHPHSPRSLPGKLRLLRGVQSPWLGHSSPKPCSQSLAPSATLSPLPPARRSSCLGWPTPGFPNRSAERCGATPASNTGCGHGHVLLLPSCLSFSGRKEDRAHRYQRAGSVKHGASHNSTDANTSRSCPVLSSSR